MGIGTIVHRWRWMILATWLAAAAVLIGSVRPSDPAATERTTFLPADIAGRYDELWARERMRKVIEAAVRHGVAIKRL